jgi:hypothetical protein
MIRLIRISSRVTAVVLAAILTAAHAQSPAADPTSGFRLKVVYDRPGLPVPHWQITVPDRGLSEYTGKPTAGGDPGVLTFRMSNAGRARLGTLLQDSNGMQPCETKAKGIANMGAKVIDYTPAGGPEQHCAFNYTDNKPLSQALDYVLAIAGTLQVGTELERLHRYDRLGLDPVMSRFSEDAKQGRATEIGAIRPTLESLATDVAVLERVRARAQQLLDLADQQEKATP